MARFHLSHRTLEAVWWRCASDVAAPRTVWRSPGRSAIIQRMRKRSAIPHWRSLLAVAAAACLGAANVGAHDFWLVPDVFAVAASGEIVVKGQTSSAFPTTLSAVTPDRITHARAIGAVEDERIDALSTLDNSLILRHRPKVPGQKVIAVAVGWRHVKETAESFRKYLVAEGAADALARYDRSGQLPRSDIVRRYAKYGKTVVDVGDGPRAFERVAGHPLEFIPLADPAGEGQLQMRLIFQGRPLAGARVHAGMAPRHGKPAKDVTLVTSDAGIISVPSGAGLWNVRTIHVVPASAGADAQWDVHWATFVYPRK